jgi:hypothetical protein
MVQNTKLILALAICLAFPMLASAQATKRDFTKLESVMGVPKICLTELSSLNFQSDCISIVEFLSDSGH